ncbi:MAG: hypothetical protein ABW321_26490 [Polyangiales bacterium]
MFYERKGHVMILVHGPANPSEQEWGVYVQDFASAQLGQDPVRCVLVVTLGGAPNAKQRSAVLAISPTIEVRTSVCTDNVIARGVLTAMSWINKYPMYAYKRDDLDSAMEKLNVPPDWRADVKSIVWRKEALLTTREPKRASR